MATSRRAGRCTDRLSGRPAGERERSDRPGSNRRSTGPAGRTAGCSTESGRPGDWGTHKSAPAPGGRPPHPGRGLAPPGSRRILTPNPRRRFDPAATDHREPITAREDRLYGVLRPGPATSRPRPVNGAQNGSEEPPDDFPAPRAGETGRGPSAACAGFEPDLQLLDPHGRPGTPRTAARCCLTVGTDRDVPAPRSVAVLPRGRLRLDDR